MSLKGKKSVGLLGNDLAVNVQRSRNDCSASNGIPPVPKSSPHPPDRLNRTRPKTNRTSFKYPEIVINSKAQSAKFRWGSYYNNGSSEQASLFDDDQAGGKHVCLDKCASLSTPLHEAAKDGNSERVEMLLDNIEVNPNARDCLGRTPLHYAVKGDCNCDSCIANAASCVNLIVKCPRTDINIQDHNGETPLHLAAENQATKAAEVLLYNGADVSIKSKSGVKAVKLMVEKIPDAMECLLTRAVSIVKYDASNAKCEVKMDFGAIVGYELKLNSRDSGRGKTPPVTDSTRKSYRKETQLLTLIHESGNRSSRKKILTHPLIAIFLYKKWRCVRPLFWAMILFHSALLVLYTLYILDVYVISCPYRPKITEPAHVKAAKAAGIKEGFITNSNETIRAEYIKFSWFQFSPQLNLKQIELGILGNNIECILEIGPTVKSILLLTLTTLMTFNELFVMLPSPLLYWKATSNQFQWAYFLLIYLTAWPVFMESPNISFWQYQAAAFGLFLAWSMMLFQIAKFPKLGLYVEILSQVLKNFGFFMLTYASILIAFALAFCVLFPGNAAYSSIPLAILKVMMLMVGEVDYENLFYGEEESPVDDLFYPVTGHVLYGLFVIMITIVLMNLLVGLTVSDIQGLQKDAEVTRLSRQISEISQLESFVFSKRLQSIFPGRLGSYLRDRILVVRDAKHSGTPPSTTADIPSVDSCCFTIFPNDPHDKSVPEFLKASILRVAESRHRINRTNQCKNQYPREAYAAEMSPVLDEPRSLYTHLGLPLPHSLLNPSSTHSLFVPHVQLGPEDTNYIGQSYGRRNMTTEDIPRPTPFVPRIQLDPGSTNNIGQNYGKRNMSTEDISRPSLFVPRIQVDPENTNMIGQNYGRRHMSTDDIPRPRRKSSSGSFQYDYFSKKLEDKIMDRMKIQMDALYQKLEEKINEMK